MLIILLHHSQIIEPSDHFAVILQVVGSADFHLQALCWTAFPGEELGRLFGVSLKGFVFEVDLAGGSIINIQDTFSGAAWSLASSPRSPLLAIGGEDGSIRLFRYFDHNRVEYAKSLPTSGSRVLSLAYHPSQPHIFLGCSDGTIRCLHEVRFFLVLLL